MCVTNRIDEINKHVKLITTITYIGACKSVNTIIYSGIGHFGSKSTTIDTNRIYVREKHALLYAIGNYAKV